MFSGDKKVDVQNADMASASTVTRLTSRRYIMRHKNVNYREIRDASQNAPYKLGQVLARGAESVLYSGSMAGHPICVKAIRNSVNKWIGDSVTRAQKEKLDSVSYRTKIRHLHNEYAISRKLYDDAEIPVVHIYALRRVTFWGLELGFDLLMEPLNGHDLADKIVYRTLGFEDKVKVLYQAVQALDYVHRRGIIHLDVKPSNFMLNDGMVKLFDFGVSVPNGYRPGAITGTSGYLAPEQICKEPVDERTDLFALGVTFAVFFGGKMLTQPQDELLQKQTRLEAKYHLEHHDGPVINEIPELASVPKLADIIKTCTIPSRDKRMKNCQTMLNQIKLWADEAGMPLE